MHWTYANRAIYFNISEIRLRLHQLDLSSTRPRHFDEMASQSPLLSGTIEADDETPVLPKGNIGTPAAKAREPEILVPGSSAGNKSITNVEEGGIVSHSLSLTLTRTLTSSLGS